MYYFDEAWFLLDRSGWLTPMLLNIIISQHPFIKRTGWGGSASLLILLWLDGLSNMFVQHTSVVTLDVFNIPLCLPDWAY